MLKAALSVSPVPETREYVNVLPASGSLVESVPTVAFAPAFSGIEVEERLMLVGASFTSVTLMVKTFSVEGPPWSVERTRTE